MSEDFLLEKDWEGIISFEEFKSYLEKNAELLIEDKDLNLNVMTVENFFNEVVTKIGRSLDAEGNTILGSRPYFRDLIRKLKKKMRDLIQEKEEIPA